MSDEDFIRAWMSSNTTAEVSRKVGITARSCTVRACRLRKAGVELPRYREPGGGTEREVIALNKLIRSLSK